MTSTPSPKQILFVTAAIGSCGVYQYGQNLVNALKKSNQLDIDCLEVSDFQKIDEAVARKNYDAILYNYHPETLRFIRPSLPRRYRAANIAIMHEMTQAEADHMGTSFFQFYAMGDPTLQLNNPRVFRTGRFLLDYENRFDPPAIPTIGTFGFSVGSKGYQRLIDLVQEEFDEAIIRLHIPSNGVVDAKGEGAERELALCRQRLWKPGIKIEASRDFLTMEGMLDFLAQNTINVFPYEYLKVAGISSSTDHAMAVRRPVAISRSIMFRHLHHLQPPITIEDSTLKEVIGWGIKPYEPLLSQWSAANICTEYENIVAQAVRDNQAGGGESAIIQTSTFPLHSGVFMSKLTTLKNVISLKVSSLAWRLRRAFSRNILAPLTARNQKVQFNRILDDKARYQYRDVIARLHRYAPETLKEKIPEANIQQAFVLDTVERMLPSYASPRLLCVGSFEDTASETLKRQGIKVDEVDPVVNKMDLNTFYHQPTTRPQSYDIIFSTSVIEHVANDEQFISQIVDLLSPGGVAVLTCDFKDDYRVGDPVIKGDFRFYSRADLQKRILPLLKDCVLVDEPRWDCPNPDFQLGGFRYTFATLVFQKKKADRINLDWDRMNQAEQRRFYNEKGFLLVPQMLGKEQVDSLLRELDRCGLKGTTEAIWEVAGATDLVDNSKLRSALTAILGRDVKFFKAAYVETPPSQEKVGQNEGQRKALHVDYGIGEQQGDYRNSCPSWINVGIYLTDLTPKHAPLWVVPGSNRFYDVVPGTDHERFGPDAAMVLAKAGDAVLFHCNTVHAASVNASPDTRHAFFLSFRPAWAKPVGNVPEWPMDIVDRFSGAVRAMFLDLNKGL